jgi:hypothetical protein
VKVGEFLHIHTLHSNVFGKGMGARGEETVEIGTSFVPVDQENCADGPYMGPAVYQKSLNLIFN